MTPYLESLTRDAAGTTSRRALQSQKGEGYLGICVKPGLGDRPLSWFTHPSPQGPAEVSGQDGLPPCQPCILFHPDRSQLQGAPHLVEWELRTWASGPPPPLHAGLGLLEGELQACVGEGWDGRNWGALKTPQALPTLRLCPHTGLRLSVVGCCVFAFFVGLLFVQRSGNYFVTMFDDYSATLPLTVIVILENVAVAWIYGTKK